VVNDTGFSKRVKDPFLRELNKIWSNSPLHTLLNNKNLTPAFGGQFVPAKGNLGQLFFQLIKLLIVFSVQNYTLNLVKMR
jgi:hypothetical protein